MLSQRLDAIGQLILAHYEGRPSAEIIERDDRWFGVSTGAPAYFAPCEKWPSIERRAIRLVRGRVLDVGCGAGRVALRLQAGGYEVVSIDVSPLAIKTCRLRGVRDARVCSITSVSSRLGEFDTVIMFGNNFGLFGHVRRARWLLNRLHGLTSQNARILAESRDPYQTTSVEHRRWFDYLIVSPREMRDIVAGTGWRIAKVIRTTGPDYVAVLEKTAAQQAGVR